MCRLYHHCQKCIDVDHVDCPEWAPYKYRGIVDKLTGKKSIQCLNKSNSCRKHHCECDQKLAFDLKAQEQKWNQNFSQKSGFKKEQGEDSFINYISRIRNCIVCFFNCLIFR
jgi:hypothetical protein